MQKKTILAIVLAGVGIITGMLDIVVYGLTGGNQSVILVLLIAPIVCIVAGSILAFSQLLDRYVNPVIEELHADIEDDIQDIKERRITNTHIMIMIVGISALAFAFFVFRFHKLEAMWGSIPVAIPTLVAIWALAWFIPRSKWYTKLQMYTPMWVFLIPTVGLILSLMLGIGRTEDPRAFTTWKNESIQYNTFQFASIIFQSAPEPGGSGFSLDLPSCDDDACLAVFLVVALIVLTIILVAGSAMFPHFWLFSGSILVCFMALIAIHDLRVRRNVARENSK
jgi:hypothetical protein